MGSKAKKTMSKKNLVYGAQARALEEQPKKQRIVKSMALTFAPDHNPRFGLEIEFSQNVKKQ
jgi:hypothetical protein